MPRQDISSAKNTEGRGRQVDAYGFLNQMEKVPSGSITPLDPKLQTGEIQAGSVTQGRNVNPIGGDNITSQLADLLNVVVEGAPKVAQSIKTVQEVHDKNLIEDEEKAFQQRKTATAEDLSEQGKEIKPWGELSLTERSAEQAAHLKKIQEKLWSKDNKFFFGTKITENILARPTLSADELLLTMKEQRLAILASDVDEDTKINQLTELTESMYNSLQLNETIQKDEEAADKVRMGLYSAEIEDEGLVEDALEKYLKETMPGVSKRIEEFTNQLLTNGDEETLLANPEFFWPAFVEWAGPALQEPFQSDEAFVEAFTEKYTPEYVKLRDAATKTSLEKLRKRALEETRQDTSIAAKAMAQDLSKSGPRLSSEDIADTSYLRQIARGWSKMKEFGNVDVAQTHLVQALSSIVVPASLNHIAHYEDTPLEAVDRTLEKMVKPWLESTGFNFTETQVNNVINRIKGHVESQLLDLDNSPGGAVTQLKTRTTSDGVAFTEITTNPRTHLTAAASHRLPEIRERATKELFDTTSTLLHTSLESSVNEAFFSKNLLFDDIKEVANFLYDREGQAAFTDDILNLLMKDPDSLFTEKGRTDLTAKILLLAKQKGDRSDEYNIPDRLSDNIRKMLESMASDNTLNAEIYSAYDILDVALNDNGQFDSDFVAEYEKRLAAHFDGIAGDSLKEARQKAGINISKNGEITLTDDPFGVNAQRKAIIQSRAGNDYISDTPSALHQVSTFADEDVSNPHVTDNSSKEIITEILNILVKENSVMGSNASPATIQSVVTNYIQHKLRRLPGINKADLISALSPYTLDANEISESITELKTLVDSGKATEDQKKELDILEAQFVENTKRASDRVSNLLSDNTIYSNRGFNIIETDRQFFDGTSGMFEAEVANLDVKGTVWDTSIAAGEGYAYISKAFKEKGLSAIADMRPSDGQSMLTAYAQSTNGEYTMASFLSFMKKNRLVFNSIGKGKDLTVEIIKNPSFKGGYLNKDGLNASVFSLGKGNTAQQSDVPLTKTSPMFSDPDWQRNFTQSAEFAVQNTRIAQREADAMTGLVSGLGKLSSEDISTNRLASFLMRSDINSPQYLELERTFLPLFSNNPDSLNLFRVLVVPTLVGPSIPSSPQPGGFDISLSDLYNLDLRMQQIASTPTSKQSEERKVLYDKNTTTDSLRNRSRWRDPEVGFNASSTGQSRFMFAVTTIEGDQVKSETFSPVFFDTDTRTINRLDSSRELSRKTTRYTFYNNSDEDDLTQLHRSTPDSTKNVPAQKPRKLSDDEKLRVERLRVKQQEQDRSFETGQNEFMRLEMQINDILYGKTIVP